MLTLGGKKIFLVGCCLCLIYPKLSVSTTPLPDVFVEKKFFSSPGYSITRFGSVAKEVMEDSSQGIGRSVIAENIVSNMGGQATDLYGDGSHATISLRGFGDNASSNTLVLVDGLPLINPDTASQNFSFLSADDIEEIKIIPESMSILYGDQAVGGVVNIIPRLPRKKERRLSLKYGSFDTKQASLLIGDLFENGVGYRVSAQSYKSQNYRRNNDNRTNHVNVLLSYALPSTMLSFSYRKLNQHIQFPGALTLQEIKKDRRQSNRFSSHNQKENDFLHAKLEHQFTHAWQLQGDFFFQQMAGNGFFGSSTTPVRFNESREVQQFLSKIKGEIDVSDYTFSPLFGLELNKGGYVFNRASSDLNKGAVFTLISFPLVKRFVFITGVRRAIAYYDLFSAGSSSRPSHYATVSTAKLLWNFDPALQCFIHFSENYRFPKVDEQVWTEDQKPLKTQTGLSYEGGLIFSKELFKAFVQVYQLSLKNEIIGIPSSQLDYRTVNKNVQSTQRRGVILDATAFLSPKTRINFSYHHVDAIFHSGVYKDKTLPFISENTFRLAAHHAPKQNWSVFLETLFVGSRYPLNDAENRASPLGGWSVYNIGVAYDHTPYAITLRINNLTNKMYYSCVVVTYTGIHGKELTESFYPASGVNGLIEFSLKI